VQDDYDDAIPLEPDHDSTTVWSDDDRKNITRLLSKHNGDINKFLCDLFGGSCSYEMATRLAGLYASELGLTHTQFMYKYFKWRRGEL
jgi:hypothetical protein